jgi:hypothetical protein
MQLISKSRPQIKRALFLDLIRAVFIIYNLSLNILRPPNRGMGII